MGTVTTNQLNAKEVLDHAGLAMVQRLAAIGTSAPATAEFLLATLPPGSRALLGDSGVISADADPVLTNLGREVVALAAERLAGGWDTLGATASPAGSPAAQD